MKIGLVGCTKSKLDHAAPAKELYMPSPLFRGRRRYVEDSCDGWFILSAKHGLVDPDQELEPYDVTLVGARGKAKQEWSDRVVAQIKEQLDEVRGTYFEIHAGRDYWGYGLADFLLQAGAGVVVPAGGLSQGEQLRFYKLDPEAAEELDAEDEQARRERAAERFVWRAGDIRWIVPPGSPQQKANTKYAPLRELLSGETGNVIKLTFQQLEARLGARLPDSARNHAAWWANTASNHQAKSWLEPGWRVEDLNLIAEHVTFRRFR